MYGFFFCTLPVVWFGGRGFCALLCYAWNLYTTMTLSINITTLLPLQNDFDSFDALKILAFEAFSLQSQFWKTKRKSTHNSPGLLLPLTRLYPFGGAFSCMPWNMNAHMCPCHTNGTHTLFIESVTLWQEYRYCMSLLNENVAFHHHHHRYLECCRCVQMYAIKLKLNYLWWWCAGAGVICGCCWH